MAFKFKMVMDGKAALEDRFKAMSEAVGKGRAVVEVGFAAPYAIYVHEAVAMKLQGLPRDGGWPGFYWDPQGEGQAKFLEEPARTKRFEISAAVHAAVKQGLPLDQAMLVGGNLLLREAQRLAPLRMGELRRSGYCRLQGGGNVSMRKIPPGTKGPFRHGQGTRRQGIYGLGRAKKGKK